MKNTKQFYEYLAFKESSNKPKTINKAGYIGLYQMGEGALIDVGYYKRGELDKTPKKNDWTGIWTGKDGIKSKEDFLFNPEVQHKAIKEYHSLIWNRYLKDYHQYEGKKIKGIILTKAGMVACAHLVGAGDLIKFIDSDGRIDQADDNQITCTKYLSDFANYELNFNEDINFASKQGANDMPWDKITSVFDKDQDFGTKDSEQDFSFEKKYLEDMTAKAIEMGTKAVEAQRQMKEEGFVIPPSKGNYIQDVFDIASYSNEILRRAAAMPGEMNQEKEEL